MKKYVIYVLWLFIIHKYKYNKNISTSKLYFTSQIPLVQSGINKKYLNFNSTFSLLWVSHIQQLYSISMHFNKNPFNLVIAVCLVCQWTKIQHLRIFLSFYYIQISYYYFCFKYQYQTTELVERVIPTLPNCMVIYFVNTGGFQRVVDWWNWSLWTQLDPWFWEDLCLAG